MEGVYKSGVYISLKHFHPLGRIHGLLGKPCDTADEVGHY